MKAGIAEQKAMTMISRVATGLACLRVAGAQCFRGNDSTSATGLNT